MFKKANRFLFIILLIITQLGFFKSVYASERISKACSNSVSDGVLYDRAQSGDVDAQHFLGRKLFSPSCTSEEQEKGLELLMQAAQGDHPDAHFILGYMLFENAQNDREIFDALRHLEKSSQLGYPPAKSYLGSILLHNASTAKEKSRAINLLKTAALSGSSDAATTLYHIYFSGLYGEKKSVCIANFWFALNFKRDTLSPKISDLKVVTCSDGERITVLD